MSIRIPLVYCEIPFTHALVDDDRELLRDLGPFLVTVPSSLRDLAERRPDIILAVLREDEAFRFKCRPFVIALNTQVQLVHMVLRPEIAECVEESRPSREQRDRRDRFVARRSPFDLKIRVNTIRSEIGRISYVNGDHRDCRMANLREIRVTSHFSTGLQA